MKSNPNNTIKSGSNKIALHVKTLVSLGSKFEKKDNKQLTELRHTRMFSTCLEQIWTLIQHFKVQTALNTIAVTYRGGLYKYAEEISQASDIPIIQRPPSEKLVRHCARQKLHIFPFVRSQWASNARHKRIHKRQPVTCRRHASNAESKQNNAFREFPRFLCRAAFLRDSFCLL